MTKIAVSIPGAQEISGLSRSAIYRAVKEQKLPLRKNGRASLILVADLERYVESLPVAA